MDRMLRAGQERKSVFGGECRQVDAWKRRRTCWDTTACTYITTGVLASMHSEHVSKQASISIMLHIMCV